MSDFELQVSGVELTDWRDPPTANPSRLNPRAGRSEKRYLGTVGVAVVLTAIVDGVTGPADTLLEGRLFVPGSVEAPHPWPVGWVPATAGYSSVRSFMPAYAGHYLVYLRRPGGGAVFIHIDARASS